MNELQTAALIAVEAVKILRLEPGDTIVLRVPFPMRGESLRNLSAIWAKQFVGHKTVVLDSGMDVEIVREQPA